MKKLSISVKIVICLGLALLTLSCSASKKWKAANILKQCEFSFENANIDGFKGDSIKFSVFLNVNNKGKDSLFAQSLSGTFYLDSLFEVPFALQNPVWLSPGNNQLSFSGAIQLNLFKIMALPGVETFTLQGNALIALKPEQKATDMSFSQTHDIPRDFMENQIKKLLKLD
ncbi:MAG: hypothetical protein FWH22_04565 [Fibromonadales bacterium]|nr:hypothetical protein [Fibromonadales bacterium]